MIVFLEGPVAGGKSTVVERLSDRYPAFPEPVDLWTKHLAGVYGEAAADWLLPMQLLALTTRHELLLRAAEASAAGATVLVERSPRSDALFARDLAAGRPKDAYDTARLAYEALVGPQLSGARHVYLRADPETCMARIATRGRPSERGGGITLERAREMHRRHEAEFARADDVVVDANRGTDEVVGDVLRAVRRLEAQAPV